MQRQTLSGSKMAPVLGSIVGSESLAALHSSISSLPCFDACWYGLLINSPKLLALPTACIHHSLLAPKDRRSRVNAGESDGSR
jgi:hypothetical protein